MKGMINLLLLLPLFTSPACQPSRTDTQDQAFESLISAERAFASTSLASGTRTAFLEFFAADGVVFEGGPVNARTVWEQRPEDGAILSWGPEIADVSAAGDMGYTSGPYEVRFAPEADAEAWGHFISVWKRDAEGTWKVVADGGVVHGPATLSADSVVVRAGGGVDRLSLDVEIDPVAAGPKLLESDEQYSRSVAEKGFADAMVDWVHRSARFYRNGHLPLVGWEVITTTASVTNAVWTDWEIRAAIVSNSGDLGCTYGVVRAQSESDGGSPQLHASYYRIWKQDADSSWRVVVDVLIPIVTSRE